MNEIEIMPQTLPVRKIDLDIISKVKLLNNFQEEKQVIIHCFCNCPTARIWKTTYLIPKGTGRRSELIHAHGITMYPIWTNVGGDLNFTLIFTGLPKECRYFDFVEQIPEPGGWIIKNIPRIKTDIYHLNLDEMLY